MVIGFVQIKGGVGKTLLCCHAALWLHEHDQSVHVIDTDTQHAARRWITEAAPELPVESALDTATLTSQVARATKTADVVLIDGAAGLSPLMRTIIRIADRVVLPVTPSMPDLLAAEQTIALIDSIQPARQSPLTAWLLLNRAQKGRRLTQEATEAIINMGLPVAQQALFLHAAFQDAFGSAVWHDGPGAAAATREMSRLLRGILMDVQPWPNANPA
jgi:chromosome partitioning protein